MRILNGYLTPLPGTPLGDNPEKFGILSGNTALKRYFNFKQHSIYKTFDELSIEEMEEYFPQRTDQMHELTLNYDT